MVRKNLSRALCATLAGVAMLAGAQSRAELCLTPPAAINANAAFDAGVDYEPSITSDGAGHLVAVWYGNDTLGGIKGTDYDIIFSHSDDNGQTWSAPAPLNTNAGSDVGIDQWPKVRTDGAGNWVCIWRMSDDTLGGTKGLDDDILFARSTDNGATWTDPAPVNSDAGFSSDNSKDDVWEDLAVDSAGTFMAIWLSLDSQVDHWDTYVSVSRSTDGGVTWSPKQDLFYESPSDANPFPSIAGDGAGGWVAVMDDHNYYESHGQLLTASSTDNGATWTPATNPYVPGTFGTRVNQRPEVATDGAGGWIIAWQFRDATNIGNGTDVDLGYIRSTDVGATWSAPALVNPAMASDSKPDLFPQLAIDGTGRWLMTWATGNSPRGAIGDETDVLASLSSDGGLTWDAPFAINTPATPGSLYNSQPQVASLGASGWVVCWQSDDTLGGTIGSDVDDLFTIVGDCATPSPTATETPTETPSVTPTPTPEPTTCDIPGDLNHDCCVNIQDFFVLIDNWQFTWEGTVIGLNQFLDIVGNWQEGCEGHDH